MESINEKVEKDGEKFELPLCLDGSIETAAGGGASAAGIPCYDEFVKKSEEMSYKCEEAVGTALAKIEGFPPASLGGVQHIGRGIKHDLEGLKVNLLDLAFQNHKSEFFKSCYEKCLPDTDNPKKTLKMMKILF